MERMMEFKAWPEWKRINLATSLMQKHKNRFPCIVDRADVSAPRHKRFKFLVPGEMSCAKFFYEIRITLGLDPSAALFFFVDGTYLVPPGALLEEMYMRHKNKDGFLYFTYSLENAFGGRESCLEFRPPSPVLANGRDATGAKA